MTFEDSYEDISFIYNITYIDVVEILVSEEDEFGPSINEPIGKTFLEEFQSFLHLVVLYSCDEIPDVLT